MYQDTVQPVDGVSSDGSLTALHQDAVSQEANWEKALQNKNAVHTYSCYFMVIELINHIGLDKLDGAIIAESQLMDVQHQMQQAFVDIGKFITMVQGQEAGYHSFAQLKWNDGPPAPEKGLAADSYLGLNAGFYGMDCWNASKEFVSSDYQTALGKFKAAIEKVFYCNTDSNAPTVQDLSSITNPNVYQHGQDFDLSGFWKQLSSLYGAAGFNKDGFNMVSGVSSDHTSLLQQYMYYKAQVAVYTGSTQDVDAAGGDITKLVDFSPVGDNVDPFINQMLQTLNQFNIQVSVSNTAGSPYLNGSFTTSGNILDLILTNRDNMSGRGPDWHVGLYGAFNFMAYNSYWSKPNAAEGISPNPTAPFPGYQCDGTGVGGGDTLSTMSTNINSTQATIGNNTGTNSTVMQELSANEGEIVNVGQNAIQSLNQATAALMMNQISS